MKRSHLIGLVGALALSGLFLMTPATRARSNNCQRVKGHIAGEVIGPSDLCSGGLTETGTFTDNDGNTLGKFVACATDPEQGSNGRLKLQLVHIYSTNGHDSFTTSDSVVLSPIDPSQYSVNNRALVTGGTGIYRDAFGFIEDHGTFIFTSQATGVLSVDYQGQICTP